MKIVGENGYRPSAYHKKMMIIINPYHNSVKSIPQKKWGIR
jgi:hypothetical protein